MSSLSRSACPPCGGGRSPPCSVARSGHAPHLRPPALRPRGPGTPPPAPLRSRGLGQVSLLNLLSRGENEGFGARTRATSRPRRPGLTAEEAESSGVPPPTPRAGRQGAHGGSAAGGQAGRVPVPRRSQPGPSPPRRGFAVPTVTVTVSGGKWQSHVAAASGRWADSRGGRGQRAAGHSPRRSGPHPLRKPAVATASPAGRLFPSPRKWPR